ncbi:MAG TPA: leucyl aminopeptidase family protein, partial [Thiobacillaceae bacterium]
MLPKLTENKQELTAKSLDAAGHALLLLPESRTVPAMPGGAELKAALKRRDLKADALTKTPVAFQTPGGTLAVVAMLKAGASAFETHEQVRRALALLVAEHPKSLTLAVFGDAEFRARAAEAAAY